MSMSFYTYTEIDGEVKFYPEDYDDRPNFANYNARMILRSLDLTIEDGAASFDAADLLARVTLARACPPVADDGQPDVRVSNHIMCGVRPGYFADAYERIAAVCELAISLGTKVVVA